MCIRDSLYNEAEKIDEEATKKISPNDKKRIYRVLEIYKATGKTKTQLEKESRKKGPDFDYILFDACLMSQVEVAYELRDTADYLILSPAEVMSAGFPYFKITKYLLSADNSEQNAINCLLYTSRHACHGGLYDRDFLCYFCSFTVLAISGFCRPGWQPAYL